MQRQQLIADLLETRSKKIHRRLLKKHADLIDLKLAEEIKNTYYDSWTREPLKTRNAAQALEVLSEIIPDDGQVKALAIWVKGIADLAEGQTEKAIVNLDKAAQIFTALEKPYQAAQTQVGKQYALALLGRYEKAVDCGKQALQVFDFFNDEISAGKIENNIGNIFIRQELLREAEEYYSLARARFERLGNIEQLTISEIGLANTYSNLNDFRKAEKYYNKTLAIARRNVNAFKASRD